MNTSRPASLSAARSLSASPPGNVGASQPWGSPRKNWMTSDPVALATASGSPSRSWAPMRTMPPSVDNPRAWLVGQRRGTLSPRCAGLEAAVRDAESGTDECGDQPGDDDHPLGSRRGDHLRVQADPEAGDPHD